MSKLKIFNLICIAVGIIVYLSFNPQLALIYFFGAFVGFITGMMK